MSHCRNQRDNIEKFSNPLRALRISTLPYHIMQTESKFLFEFIPLENTPYVGTKTLSTHDCLKKCLNKTTFEHNFKKKFKDKTEIKSPRRYSVIQ